MLINNLSDPIIAIATPPGRGGVAVIRLSSPSKALFDFLLKEQVFSIPILGSSFDRLKARFTYRAMVIDEHKSIIDDGILIFFSSPFSYTGEFVVEFQGHGGIAIVQMVLDRLIDAGKYFQLRLAKPGEFTERAFINHKMDLTQAEAVADLIDASTHEAARAAMRSLSGVFSEKINLLNEKLIDLRSLIEAVLDFPEEDIDFIQQHNIADRLADMLAELTDVLENATTGNKLREGLDICLVGPPNVGKSSILNVLAGDEVAIVSEYAGTTRDRVICSINLLGLKVNVIDTAGLREETQDPIEVIGIERTRKTLDQVDLIIQIFDSSKGWTSIDQAIYADMPDKSIVIVVGNKLDLVSANSNEVFSFQADTKLEVDFDKTRSGLGVPMKSNPILISAKSRQGFDELKNEIVSKSGYVTGDQPPFLARQRHLIALKQAVSHCKMAQSYLRADDKRLELLAEELRLAHNSLGEIVGKILPDDLLGVIFSKFCIGK